VRATLSGAGCGSHWPLCNGEVIPQAPTIETLVEYAHRLSSGLSFILVAFLFFWAYKKFPNGSIIRLGATLSFFFIITEALVGAGLVLFDWVAENVSIGRVISMSIHLINTFLLLASLTLTAYWATFGVKSRFQMRSPWVLIIGVGLFGVLVIGITGAITALGDTIFPSKTLIEGIQQDFSPTAHFLIRLRIWHPVIAIVTGFYILFISIFSGLMVPEYWTKRFSIALVGLFVIQIIAGLVNLYLLAPVWMQVVHLFLADVVWIVLILLSATILDYPELQSQEEYSRESTLSVQR